MQELCRVYVPRKNIESPSSGSVPEQFPVFGKAIKDGIRLRPPYMAQVHHVLALYSALHPGEFEDHLLLLDAGHSRLPDVFGLLALAPVDRSGEKICPRGAAPLGLDKPALHKLLHHGAGLVLGTL